MGCGGSKQHVVPYDSNEQDGNRDSIDSHVPTIPGRTGGKSIRLLVSTQSARQVNRKENRSFFDKSRNPKQFDQGTTGHGAGPSGVNAKGTPAQQLLLANQQHHHNQHRVVAFASRTPNRLDGAREDGKASQAAARSRFAKSIKAVTDAVFGPPPDWILRQTAPIKTQYQFLGVVGKGQFGQVYCIKHSRQGTRFACKTLGKKKLLSQLDAEDIKREIEVMHHLTGHDLVVSLHRVYEDEKNVHLVMDLCQGGDLYEMLRDVKYLGEDKAAPLMLQALRAVQYCHSMGVVHRDIKPENFLLAKKDDMSHIRLTDFGLSTFYQEGQIFNELLGSPYYIAPEVIKQKYGKEADVWSCGVMLYIMLCGEAPFFGEGDEGIFKSIMKAKLDFSFEPWPSLSRDVKVLLRRMLVKDPRERATLEEIVAHPWFARFALGSDSVKSIGGVGGISGREGGGRLGLPPLQPSPSRGLNGGLGGVSFGGGGSGGAENTLFLRLKQYSRASRTKKAALRYIVGSMPEEVTAGLYNLFQDFDQDVNNAIDTRELREGFLRRNVVLLEEEAAVLLNAADMDGDGVLTLIEWMSATVYIPEEQLDGLLSEAFAFADTDHDGYLGPGELVAYLGATAAAGGDAEARQLAAAILQEADADMDGRVSEDEFLAAYLMGSGSGGASRPDTAGDGAAPTRGGRGPAGLRPLGSEGSAGGGGSSITAPLGTQGGRLVSVTSVKSFGADVGGGKPGSVMAPVRPREAVAAAAVAREGPGVRLG